METIKKYSIRKTIVGVGSVLIGTFFFSIVSSSNAYATNSTIIENKSDLIIPYVEFEIENNTLTKEQELEVTKKIKELNNFEDNMFSVVYNNVNVTVTRVGYEDYSFPISKLKEKDLFNAEILERLFYMNGHVYVKDINNITEKEKNKLYNTIIYSYEYYNENLRNVKIEINNEEYILSAENVRPFKFDKKLFNTMFSQSLPYIIPRTSFSEMYAKNSDFIKIENGKDLPEDFRENVDLDYLYFLMRYKNLNEWNDYIKDNVYLKKHNIKHIEPVGYSYGYDENKNVILNDLSNSFAGDPRELNLKINVFYEDGTYKEEIVKVVDKDYESKYNIARNFAKIEELFEKNKHLGTKADRVIDVFNKLNLNELYYISKDPLLNNDEVKLSTKKLNFGNRTFHQLTQIVNAFELMKTEDGGYADEISPYVAENMEVIADRLSLYLENPKTNNLWYNMLYVFSDGSKIYAPVLLSDGVENYKGIFSDTYFYNLAVIDKNNFVDFVVEKTLNDVVSEKEEMIDNASGIGTLDDNLLTFYYERTKRMFNVDISYETFKEEHIKRIWNSNLTSEETNEVLDNFRTLYYESVENKLGSVFFTNNLNSTLYRNSVEVSKENYLDFYENNKNIFRSGLKYVYSKNNKVYELDMGKTLDFALNSLLLKDVSHGLRQYIQKEKIKLIKELWENNSEALQDYKMFKNILKEKINKKENIYAFESGLEYDSPFILEDSFPKDKKIDFYIDLTFGNIFNFVKNLINGDVTASVDLFGMPLNNSYNEITNSEREERQQGLGNLEPWMNGFITPMFFDFGDNYPHYVSNIYFYNEVEKEEKHPNTYPTWELPEAILETIVPNTYPTIEKPEAEVGIYPNTYPTWELPSIEIPEIPNIPPNTTDNEGTPPLPPEPDPEPDEESTHPNTYPTWGLPEAEVGVHPNTYPTIDKPEGGVGIYPNTYPTWELPEINLDFKVPNTYPTIEKPEANLDFKIPNTYPTWEMPSIEFPTKPTPPPVVPEDKIEIPPKEKELPKTNTSSTYMYTLTSLISLSLLLKRKLSTK